MAIAALYRVERVSCARPLSPGAMLRADDRQALPILTTREGPLSEAALVGRSVAIRTRGPAHTVMESPSRTSESAT